MAKRNKKAAADQQPDDAQTAAVLGNVAWAVLAGAWLFMVLALVSYDPADAPSLTHGIPNQTYHNWAGKFGALIAHKTYLVVGPGAWVALAAVALYLLATARAKPIDQLPLRLVGLVMMTVAASGLVGVGAVALVTGIQPGPHAPGGLLATFINDQMSMRFGVLGTLIVLLVGFWVGAILAMDQLVLAVPRVLGELMLRLTNLDLPRPGLRRFVPRLATFRSGPWSLGGKDKTTLRPKPGGRFKRRDKEQEDELDEQTGGLGGTESFGIDDDEPGIDEEHEDDADGYAYYDEDGNPIDPSELDQYETDEDEAYEDEEDEDEEEDADQDASASDSEDAPKQFDPDELRAKMKQLPINFAPKVKKSQQQEIPREPDFSGYQFPSIHLLEEPEGNFTAEIEQIVRDQAVQLESALQQYKIEGEVVGIDSGPVITMFEVRLAPGTKVSRLSAVDSDLARALKAQNIRIVPNMAGKDTVGIEVPNIKKERVRLQELMTSHHDVVSQMKLPMFLGKDASGQPLIQDLNAMPHMLIAGTTGSGKSVCMNSIIMSFLFTKKPDELKLVLVDPKMVEMSMFKNIPHLMCPVVTEMSKAAAILEWAVTKMDERYELLSEAQVRDIASYNELGEAELKERMDPSGEEEWARIPKKMPYMVFIIDELADLMMTNKEVEASIVRIAQKARAVGIHLILATQRPQANVVTGLIKSNMPCRVAFKVASGMDSRIVLDQKGGELLLGHGDMLFLSPRSSKLTRAQGTLVDDSEIRKTVKFLKNIATQNFEPSLMQVKGADGGGEEGESMERDPLFEEAVDIVIETRRGSVSLLQRRLTIGYSRASRIIEQIAEAGMLGPYKGSQAREVVISKEEWEAMKAQAAADAEAAEAQAATAADDGEDDDIDGGAPAVYTADADDAGVPDEFDGEFRQ